MADEQRYFSGESQAGPELRRLRRLEEMFDPAARAALAGAGLGPGASVLEIGPGAGSMLRWISGQVGSSGAVTAIDLDPRFVVDLTLPNVVVQTGDILDHKDNLGPFDFIYARYVFMHFPDAKRAVGQMLDLLKPGGKLVLFDPDYRNVRPCDPDHPSATDFVASVAIALDVLRKAGIMDGAYGARCASDMEAVGFAEVHATGYCELIRGGSPLAERFVDSLPPVERAVDKYAPDQKLDFGPVYAAYRDPDFLFFSPNEIITIGTRP